ncbi:unnamed protein product [Cuscuta epithymum]|uniref:MATH domain-containing protein n=1 Tax=Cuscuta epithymum TaxID=186058 RepID=A0AAV0DE87_9ASTE|nr:unnamed protein product [Cuscuta epithymum]CAH9124033.1 unnamed protein product [Cuscuta epithymum]
MDKLKTKFTWRIENFLQLEVEKLYSVTFLVSEKKWRVLLFPRGNKTMKIEDHMSLYLDVADASSLPNGWSISTNFSLTLIDQIDSKRTTKKEENHTFHAKERDWGFHNFIPLSDLHDKSGGYLVEDTCLIEVEVNVPDHVSPCVNNKALDSSVADFDHAETAYAQGQAFLESLRPKKLSTSVPPNSASTFEMSLLKGNATHFKELLDILISSPLDDLASPESEAAVLKYFSSLNNTFLHVKGGSSEYPWSTLEKTKTLLEELLKTEEGLKTELEGLNKKETELEAQLEAMECNCRKLEDEREVLSKQMVTVCSLAKEHARKVESKKAKMEQDKNKVELSLKSKWTATKHLFA